MISMPGALDRALFYSPLSFLRRPGVRPAEDFLSGLVDSEISGEVFIMGKRARLYVRYLEWDSRHFDCPMYRLEFSDWDEGLAYPAEAIARELMTLKDNLRALHGRYYLFSEIPSEDMVMLQAMGLVGGRLIETRITYFLDELEQFNRPVRYGVRKATEADIPGLRKVAIEARNRFDRYHSDPFFPVSVADNYLATFVENSVKGFADIVMVPAEGAGPPGAFFTANLVLREDPLLGPNQGRIVLVAVGEERRGWHLRLMGEMTCHFRERGVQVAHMTTQSANRAVIRNCEKLGYRYGRCTHVFSTYPDFDKE